MSDDVQEVKKVPSVYSRLAARFPATAHKTKTIGGTGLTYVDGETVISRLNEELGLDGWSFEVKGITVLEDEVWAQGRLTVYLGERVIVREQAGGQIINRKRGMPAVPARPAQEADGDRPAIPAVPAQPAIKGEPIELSNDIKGAITDCLKKCATLAGVGLYLYDPNERREVEAEMKGAKASPPRGAAPANDKVKNAATLTGANPPTPIDPARRNLIDAHAKGVKYARSIGMEPADIDIPSLTDDELFEVVEALRSQCLYLLKERKAAAGQAS